MLDINREVLNVLTEIVESFCIENSKFDRMEIEENYSLAMDRTSDDFFLNKEIPQSHMLAKVYNEESGQRERVILNPDSKYSQSKTDADLCLEDVALLSLPDLHNNNISDAVRDVDRLRKKNLNSCTPTGSNRGETGKFKDVCVQTIFYAPGTIDGQCQCDLLPTEKSTLILEEDPEKKKRKLNICCNSYMDYGKAVCQFQASELRQTVNETNLSNTCKSTAILKSSSCIRVGLSKRFKPRPLNNG